MRVAFVTAAGPDTACGIGNYVRALVALLRQLGVDASVLSGPPRTPGLVTPDWEHPVVQSWSLWHVPWIRERLLALAPDVVHVQFPGRGFARSLAPNVLPWALRGPRGPHVITTLHEFGTASALGKMRITFGAWRSERVVAPDRAVAAEVARALSPLPFAPRVEVIPIAADIPVADVADPAALRARFSIDRDVPVAGWFGLLTREKGADVLARALAIARERRPLVLLLIGDTGDVPERSTLLDALRASAPVIETGVLPPDDAAQALASVDVVALPFANGLSDRRSSYLAAAAQGAFVVTTSPERRGLVAETNTFFVPVGDPTALADALVDPKPRMVPREGGSWSDVARAHCKLYTTLIRS